MWVERRHSIFGNIDMTKKKRDIDWTNSKTYGYGNKTHLKQKENFMRIAKAEGFAPGDTITRQDILKIEKKYRAQGEVVYASWFTSFGNKDGYNPYKIGKATFRIPSLDGVSEVVDVFSQFDKLTLEHILTAKEHQVVLLRYGINDGIIKTFDEVAEIMELTKQRVWQLCQKALLKLEEHSGTKISINLTKNSRLKY